MKDRIRSGAGFQRSLRFLNSDEQGMDSLELRLAVSRRILPALNRICERRFLRISFTSPGQVFVSPDGSVRLIVKDQSQVYQLKNLLPTLHREVEKACGFPVPEITVGVNPGLHESLSSRAETATGDPRKQTRMPLPPSGRKPARCLKAVSRGSRLKVLLNRSKSNCPVRQLRDSGGRRSQPEPFPLR